MKIRVIRGAFLNPFELQLYEPLAGRHALDLIGATWQIYPHALPPPWSPASLRRLPVTGDFLAPKTPLLAMCWNRLCSWTTGASYALQGLESIVDPADILHSAETFFSISYQALQIKRRLGVPLVVTVSENIPGSGETHPVRRLRKQAVLREADAFIAITETTRTMLIKEGVRESRITLLPMSISLKRFSPGPRSPQLLQALRIREKDPVLLFLGRFMDEKGIPELIRIAPELIRRIPNLRVCFVGSGPLERDLLKLQAERPDAVRLHPYVPYEHTVEFHRLADVLVLPSRSKGRVNEQFGFVMVESMAAGKAVVASRCGSIPDVVGDAACLISPGNERELTEAIASLLSRPEIRRDLGEKGIERCRTHYDAVKNAQRLESLYQELLQVPAGER